MKLQMFAECFDPNGCILKYASIHALIGVQFADIFLLPVGECV